MQTLPFKDWLRVRLDELGWTNSDLERASGVSNSIIWRWMSNQPRRPTPANLKKIAPHLGVSYEDLMRMCGYLPGAMVDTGPDEAELSASKFIGALRGVPRQFWGAVVEASTALAKAYAEAPVENGHVVQAQSGERPVSDLPVPPVSDPRKPTSKRRRSTDAELGNCQRFPLGLLAPV